MAKIYVVTAGEYEDNHIIAVYSSEEDALRMVDQAFVSSNYGKKARIEEFELDLYVEQLRAGLRFFEVIMGRNGNSRVEQITIDEYDPFQKEFSPPSGDPGILIGRIFAEDEDHAVETTNKKRKQLIEAGEWLEQ